MTKVWLTKIVDTLPWGWYVIEKNLPCDPFIGMRMFIESNYEDGETGDFLDLTVYQVLWHEGGNVLEVSVDYTKTGLADVEYYDDVIRDTWKDRDDTEI